MIWNKVTLIFIFKSMCRCVKEMLKCHMSVTSTAGIFVPFYEEQEYGEVENFHTEAEGNKWPNHQLLGF